jgi:hypothetical protein
MIRLEIEAQLANAEAESAALSADAALEEGRPLAAPPEAAADAPVEPSAAPHAPATTEDEAPPA